MFAKHLRLFIVALFYFLFANVAAGKHLLSESVFLPSKMDLSGEYIFPSSFDRMFHTVSANAFFRMRYFKKAKLNLDLGVTSTYAWGKIRTEQFSTVSKYYSTSGFGVGPIVRFEQTVFEYNKFSVLAESAAGPVFYNKHFPDGGDFYNFMLRAGIMFAYQLNDRFLLNLACKWMHVSNGQGSGPHNPYYEGYGINIGLRRYFGKK